MKEQHNNIVYIQADSRFNNYLMNRINNDTVIGYIAEKCKKLNASQIIWGGYRCDENRELEIELSKHGVVIYMTEEADVNLRFIDIIIGLSFKGYIIRVCGDQILLDCNATNIIVDDMSRDNNDWFYEREVSSVLPDIVHSDIILTHETVLRSKSRYFEGLGDIRGLNRKSLYYGIIPIVCRANSSEGYRICKYIVENNLSLLDLLKKYCNQAQDPKGYLSYSGLMGSWLLGWERDFFFSENGQVNAWWSDSAVNFIRSRLKKYMRVFEYGCGNSTLFFSDCVNEVTSLEHDYIWYEKMKKIIPKNVNLLFSELEYGGQYSKAICQHGEFDVILIDGRDRVNCAYNAVSALSKRGIIIWDDTDRDYYQEGYDFLEKNGFNKIDFVGVVFGIMGWQQTTSIFYRDDNCFEI